MKTLQLFPLILLLTTAAAQAQTTRVGVGTTTPRTGLDIQHNDGLLATGQGPDPNSGTPGPGNATNLPAGAGTRMLWVPQKSAFRAGTAVGTEWDYASLGNYSLALGLNTTASGPSAVALGTQATASAFAAVALGQGALASGTAAMALGPGVASGQNAAAMGFQATASGNYSLALGTLTTASGTNSMALGNLASTNGKLGSVALGDGSTLDAQGLLVSSANNEYSARFAGGYRWLSNSAMTQGLFLTGANRLGLGGTATAPRAGLDVAHNDGLVATGQGPDLQDSPGPGNVANLPSGTGTRMLWIPAKAAFRVGSVWTDNWDYANVGLFSMALGRDTRASNYAATALGMATNASGRCATAMGQGTTASGDWATALGRINTASGWYGLVSGLESTASGLVSTALGYRVTASGDFSTAIGRDVSTNGKAGSLILGDNSQPAQALNIDSDNRFLARFAGGYLLYTTGNASVGVGVAAGGNAWGVISDSTKKEGFRPADGADFLRKIAGMRLGSWNYKGQNAKTFRHYGPMAQDFFAAFGRDGVGVIGNDTTINQADFDGVNLIAIKALAQENEARRAEIQRLRAENDALKTRLDAEQARAQAETTDLRRLVLQLSADVRQLQTSSASAPTTSSSR